MNLVQITDEENGGRRDEFSVVADVCSGCAYSVVRGVPCGREKWVHEEERRETRHELDNPPARMVTLIQFVSCANYNGRVSIPQPKGQRALDL